MSDQRNSSVQNLVGIRTRLESIEKARVASIAPIATAMRNWEGYRESLESMLSKNLQPISSFLVATQSPVKGLFDQHKRMVGTLELLTQPLSKLVAMNLAINSTLSKTFGTSWEIHNQLCANKVFIESLVTRAELGSALAKVSLGGYSSLLASGGEIIDSSANGEKGNEAKIASQEITLAGAVAVAVTGDIIESEETRVVKIVASVDEVLSNELPVLRAGLFQKWTGARDALATRNPDRAAIVAYSLRELLKGSVNEMVNLYADEYDTWRTSLHDGGNSLGLKVKFLMRETLFETSFAEDDARWVKSLLDHMNEAGVHAKAAEHSDAELFAIMRRVEGFLASLFELRSR